MWIDLVVAVSCGGAGAICGWTLRALNAATSADRSSSVDESPTKNENSVSVEKVNEVAAQLKSYVHSMAADVDAHQTKVQAVNDSLTEGQGASPEEVFRAINELVEANEIMQAQLQNAQDQIHEQAVQIETAEKRAETDALTRIPNRGAFDAHFSHQHAQGAAKAGTLAVLDVDHFKKFNDVYGHRAGDEVLKVVAGIIHTRLQSCGLVARFGGEEFVVVLDDCPIETAMNFIESARAAIGQRDIQFEDKRLRVTASAGIAQLLTGEDKESWLQRADDALYKAKENGRDCTFWMDETTARRVVTKPSKAESAKNSSSDLVKGESLQATEPSKMPVETKASKPAKALSNLPNHNVLATEFDQLRKRAQSNVSVFVMAIRCNVEASNASIRSLLQIARATIRSVDRLGYHDPCTLVICMPSVDQDTALAKATQICRSATAIGLSHSNPETSGNPIGIGIAEAMGEEDFEAISVRAIDLAEQASSREQDPVAMEQAIA